jgi:predicted transcriptional regulator
MGERHARNQLAAQRAAKAAELYLRGCTQWEIARELGVSRPRVSQMLSAVRNGWHTTATAEIATHVAEQLARIQRLEREYWLAWERSRQQRERTETVVEDATLTGSPELPPGVPLRLPYGKRRARVQREARDGAAAFLSGIAWCISERSKLLGLDAPTKIDITARVRELARRAGLDERDVLAEAELLLRDPRER